MAFVARNDRLEHAIPAVGTMDVAGTPIFGALAGAAAGAVGGSLSECGMDDAFIKAINQSLQSGRAALILCRDISTESAINDHIIAKLASDGGRVLRTNLNPAQESRLKEAFEEARLALLSEATSSTD